MIDAELEITFEINTQDIDLCGDYFSMKSQIKLASPPNLKDRVFIRGIGYEERYSNIRTEGFTIESVEYYHDGSLKLESYFEFDDLDTEDDVREAVHVLQELGFELDEAKNGAYGSNERLGDLLNAKA